MFNNPEFWEYLERLIDACPVVIDRPSGTPHPRYPERIYPFDYGYLDGSTTVDRAGVDVWVGSLEKRLLVGLVCTVDLVKYDSEVKLLLGCTQGEIKDICSWLNSSSVRAIFIPRATSDCFL
jgi:inorganic pyrophosphatase